MTPEERADAVRERIMSGEAERFDEYPDGLWPWRSMSEAPKDGTQILVCRDTGCGWEFEVVWWAPHDTPPEYPWMSSNNAHVEDRFDYWQPLQPPVMNPHQGGLS